MANPNPTRVEFKSAVLSRIIAERAGQDSLGLTAARDLERYYALVEEELGSLDLTEAQASLICDALNGTLLEPYSIRLLWAEVDDAVHLNGLDRKWGVSGPALVEKLRALTPGQKFALADAVERFWRDTTVPTEERLRQVGLIR